MAQPSCKQVSKQACIPLQAACHAEGGGEQTDIKTTRYRRNGLLQSGGEFHEQGRGEAWRPGRHEHEPPISAIQKRVPCDTLKLTSPRGQGAHVLTSHCCACRPLIVIFSVLLREKLTWEDVCADPSLRDLPF